MRNPARVATLVIKAMVVSLLASIAIITGIHDAEAMPCSPSFAPPDGAVVGENTAECLRVAITTNSLVGENAFVSGTITNLWHTARVSGVVTLPPEVGGGCDAISFQELTISETTSFACMLVNGPECGLTGTVNTQWFGTSDDLNAVAKIRSAKAFGASPLLEVSATFPITEPCPETEPDTPAPDPEPASQPAQLSAVTITKTASPQSVPVGTTTTWTMTVTNAGSSPLTNVVVTTPLGEPLDPVLPLGAGQSWDPTTRTLTTSLGALAVSEAETVVFDTTVHALSQIPVTSTVVTSEGASASTTDDVFGLRALPAPPEPAPASTADTEVLGTTEQAPQLAFTGAETPLLALLGISLVAAGALFVAVGRRED